MTDTNQERAEACWKRSEDARGIEAAAWAIASALHANIAALHSAVETLRTFAPPPPEDEELRRIQIPAEVHEHLDAEDTRARMAAETREYLDGLPVVAGNWVWCVRRGRLVDLNEDCPFASECETASPSDAT